MKIVAVLVLAACSSASPEPTKSAKPRDAAPPVIDPHPPATHTNPAAAKCGEPGTTKPPTPVVQLATGNESCARLADGSVWCWGARGFDLIRSDATAPLACPVATRVDAFAGADGLWSSYRDTCVTAKGVVRCAVLADWGFSPKPPDLGVRTAFQWNGLPCGITNDSKLRCYADMRQSELASLGPAEQAIVVRDGRDLCVLSRTAVNCLHDGKVSVLASNITQLAGGDELWGLRSDGVVRIEACANADQKSCTFPVRGARDPIAIAAAYHTLCVLSRNGTVACGNCPPKQRCTDEVQAIDGITDATQIAVGSSQACALRTTGEVVCWGDSSCGQAGGTVEAGKVCSVKPIVVPPTTITWAR